MDGLKAAQRPGKGHSTQYATAKSPESGAKHRLVELRPAGPGSKSKTPAGITVAIARSFEEISAIRPIWQAMQSRQSSPKPNADIDRYTSVIEAYGSNVRPHVMLFKRNNQPVAMVIGRAEDHRLSLKLGYQNLLNPRLRGLHIVYGGILGRVEGELCSVVLQELNKQLKSGEFDIVYFNYLDTETEFYQAVLKTPGFLKRGHFPKVAKHWRMDLPETIDQFYKIRSRGHRRNLRQAIRKFEQKYSNKTNFIKYTSEDRVDDFVEVAAEISSKTYQNALGVGIANNEQTRSRIKAAAAQGWFEGSLLLAGDKPCAFQLALRYNRIYYIVSIGYDPALNSYRIGTILFLKVLESLCADSMIDAIDFYFGDAVYKNRYGTKHWPEACIYIFAPRVYPMAINALRCSVTGVNAGMVHIINKIGWTGRIKQKWRDIIKSNPG